MIFLPFAVLSLLFSKAQAAFWQNDEQLYLQNFQAITAESYAAVDDFSSDNPDPAPQDLHLTCKNGPPPSRQVTVSSSSQIVNASNVASQCGNDSICIVPEGLTLRMTNNLNVGALVVRGSLEWNEQTQTDNLNQYLCGGYIVIEENGSFEMNLQEKHGWIYIKNNGAIHEHLRSRAFGADAGESGGQPRIDITGRVLARTWSLLSKPLLPGSVEMQLLHHPGLMGWKVGDRVGVAPTERLSTGWGEVFRIFKINDDGTILLNTASTHHFKANLEAPVGGRDQAALKSAEVVNLSRNVVITGDDFEHVACDPNLPEAVTGEETSVKGCRCSSSRSTCTVGLHTVHAHGGVSRIQNVRVEKCGQRGVEGKYCLHFHKLHECKDCLFKNNAIEYGQQRGIIIHGTHLSNVEANVLYNVRGAGIYIEDGNEMWNNIAYNTVICPFPFHHSTLHGCTVPGTSNRLSDAKDNQSSFFALAGSNNHVGNRAANSFNGMFLKEGGLGRGKAYNKVCESAARIGRYEGNTFHGHGRFGTYALGNNYPKVTDQSLAANGFNLDKELCEGFDGRGNTRGLPSSFLDHMDYDNAFVGHYMAGDIQYNGHHSTDSNNLLYWKETKNFENGCGSHVVNGYYAKGTVALPDQSSFIIEDTVFGDGILLEASHHCNVGITGYLCMPQYVFHGVRWQNSESHKSWVMFQYDNFQPHSANQNHGGIFTLSPPDAATVMSGGEVEESFFPPGYVSFVSERFNYLLDLPDHLCTHGASFHGPMYSNGILCKVPLRALKIYSRNQVAGSAPSLLVEIWFNTLGADGQSGPPAAAQGIAFHQTGANYASNRQGYSVPVIPGTDHSYRLSLNNGESLPDDWVIEFSDPVMSNRWGEEFLTLTVEGRKCGENDLISGLHDRKFIFSGDDFMADQAWGRHGACVGIGTQPPDSPPLDCMNQNEYGIGGEIETTNCPELCSSDCEKQNAFCDCGTATCHCKAGFAGSNCEIDLCAAARCGIHGTCSARYLGTSSTLPVTSKACICDEGWSGPLCDKNPCQGRTCSGNGKCIAHDNTAVCECDAGHSGENCEQSCYGICRGDFPFGCASHVDGKDTLGCHSNGGCAYIGPGENYPYEGFCTYKSSQSQSPCICEAENDCQEVDLCLSNGSCPPPSIKPDGTACNSIPWGVCFAGQCVDGNGQPTAPIRSPQPAPVSAPSPLPNPTEYCACNTCTEDVWNRNVNGHTCRDRIEWLQSSAAVAVGGPFPEAEACRKIGQEEFPDICGPCYCQFEPTQAPVPPPTQSPVPPPTQAPVPPPTQAPTVSTHCSCQDCTNEVWDRNADGHSCGSRIEWLKSPDSASIGGPFTESEACRRIGHEEFPDICGACHCQGSNPPPVLPPTPAPVPAPTPPPTVNYCGCHTCTDQVWNRNADGYSCGDRIEWLQSPSAVAVGGPFNEDEACRKISREEYPEVCGLCSCIAQESCEDICDGQYPFGCATNIPGKVKYGCYPGGMCYYTDALEEEYPWDGFCTYETAQGFKMVSSRENVQPPQGKLRGRGKGI